MLKRHMLSRNKRTLLVAAALVVSLAPLEAQDLYKATVIEQIGQVSVQDAGFLVPRHDEQ